MKKNKEKKWKVYIHTNKTNKKTYIGITKNSVEDRWMYGSGYKEQVFYRAIKKYGWDGFTHEVLADNLTEEEAKQLEHNFIVLYKSKIDQHGYNVSDGGHLGSSIVAKRVCQFDGYGNLLKTFESIYEAAYYIGCKSYHISSCIYRNSFSSHGYVWLYEEDCTDISKIKDMILKNPKSHRIRPIYQFNLDCSFIKEYKNVEQVFKETNFRTNTIILCCDGKLVSTQGYYWAYKADVPDINKFSPRRKLTNTTKVKKAIVQLDKNGMYIKTFDSAKQIENELNLCANNIRQCCKGDKKSCGGYQWVYRKDYNPNLKNEYNRINYKSIYLLDKNFNIINEFLSIADASRYVGHSIECFKKKYLNIVNSETDYIWCEKSKYKELLKKGELLNI